ncbi:MAG: hypothetical protein JWQ72_3089 [Polaromonas sp.]|nr:hypothetical protein [Polaromonas sp.]
MLSLVVCLAPAPSDGSFSFALSRLAVPPPASPVDDAEPAGLRALPEHGSAPLALLPRAEEVVAVVPYRRLSWHRLTLPAIPRSRLRAALEGLLEERLLEEPQRLHFALAPGAAPCRAVWVAACDREWLHRLLQAFETAGRPVTRVVPEYQPLDEGQPAVLHVTGDAENPWMVLCSGDGVQGLPLEPPMLAALDLTGVAGAPIAAPAVAAQAEHLLGVPVHVRHAAQALVEAARSGWDLAQFDLASRRGKRVAKRLAQAWAQWQGSAAWRPARWGVASLLVVWLLGPGLGAWKEYAALQAKRSAIRDLFTQAFPRVPVVIDAPVQMEKEVVALRRATGSVSRLDLEPMLASVAEALPGSGVPSGIEFTTGKLTLRGLVLPAADAAALAQRLAGLGYRCRAEGDGWVITAATPAATGPLS